MAGRTKRPEIFQSRCRSTSPSASWTAWYFHPIPDKESLFKLAYNMLLLLTMSYCHHYFLLSQDPLICILYRGDSIDVKNPADYSGLRSVYQAETWYTSHPVSSTGIIFCSYWLISSD
jgi:hypothetical protein